MDVMKTGWHSKNHLVDTRLEHLIGSKLLFSAFDWLIDPIWLFRVPITWLAIWDLYDLWLTKHQFSQIWLDPELGFAQLSCNRPATAWQDSPDNRALFFGDCWLVIEPELRTLIGYTSNRSGSEACDWVMSLWWRTPGSLAQSPPGCLYIAPMKIIHLRNRKISTNEISLFFLKKRYPEGDFFSSPGPKSITKKKVRNLSLLALRWSVATASCCKKSQQVCEVALRVLSVCYMHALCLLRRSQQIS